MTKSANEKVDDICMLAAAQIVAAARGPRLHTLDPETMDRVAMETIKMARALDAARAKF